MTPLLHIRRCASFSEGWILRLLVSTAIVAAVHRFSGGYVLSSTAFSLGLFGVALVILMLIRWPSYGVGAIVRPDSWWVWIAGISLILLGSVYYQRELIAGDANGQAMYVLQLLNGHAEAHEFYRGAPGFYPTLVHTVIALTMNATGISVYAASVALTGVLMMLITYFLATLARLLRLSGLSAVFLIALTMLYGGFFTFEHRSEVPYVYLPAIQLKMISFMPRNLGLFLFVMFAVRLVSVWKEKKWKHSDVAILGLVVGLMGLTHPTSFMVSVLLLLLTGIRCLWSMHKKTCVENVIAALLIALLISLFYFYPMWMYAQEFGGIVNRTGYDIIPMSLVLYGPLPLLAICAIMRISHTRTRLGIIVVLALIASVWMFLVFSNTPIASLKEIFPIRPHRFGIYLSLGIFFLSALGILAIEYRNKWVAIGVVLIMLAAGVLADIRYTKYLSERRVGSNLERVIEMQEGKLPLRPGGLERVRQKLSNPGTAVVLCPPKLCYLLAYRNGVDVPYVGRPNNKWRHFFEKTIDQDHRLKLVNQFYSRLESGTVDEEVLKIFHSTAFVTTIGNIRVEKKYTRHELGVFLEKSWFLYELDSASHARTSRRNNVGMDR